MVETPLCSVVIPVFNRAVLTRHCLDRTLSLPSESTFQIIVVNDGSTDSTPQLLGEYGDRIDVVTHAVNTGFATACNDGVRIARGRYLVFLNNDTLPERGWLDALVQHVETHPDAAVTGSKLLYPDGTMQHAGVVICQDRHARHLYTGFPRNHPAVNITRRFQAVTAACCLIRRDVFERLDGFDPVFRNGYEDVDLCLRAGELGYEVWYCPESVLSHLESVSEGRFDCQSENARRFMERWHASIHPDDFQYFLDDGLITIAYESAFPLRITVSPLLALVESEEREAHRLLGERADQVFRLLTENIRLKLDAEEARLSASPESSATTDSVPSS